MKKFVLLIFQGPTPPIPGADRWKALSEAEQKSIYADYAAFGSTPGVSDGLPLGLPDAARTAEVQNGKTNVKNGTYLVESPAGYAVYEAESMEAAVELAARIPAARLEQANSSARSGIKCVVSRLRCRSYGAGPVFSAQAIKISLLRSWVSGIPMNLRAEARLSISRHRKNLSYSAKPLHADFA